MEQTTKHNMFTFFVIAIIFGMPLLFAINNYRLRGQLAETRAELTETSRELQCATATNKQLTEQIDGIREDVEQLNELSAGNITTIQDCINLVRKIRTQVKNLEDCLLGRSTDSSNNWGDNNDTNNKVGGQDR